MLYVVHRKEPYIGWKEVDAYSSYDEMPEEDKSQFDFLLIQGYDAKTIGDTMWEIRQ